MSEEEEKQPLFTPKIDAALERKKPHLEALLFCHYFSQDSDGKGNIVGAFDRILIDPEKKETGRFIIFVRTGETSGGQIVITLLDPNNELAANIAYDIPVNDIPSDRPLHAQFSGQVAFKVKIEGAFWVDISYNGVSLGGTALTIEYKKVEGEGK